MPVYNGEKYLKEAVESILNQTFKNFELLIFDDSSIDRSIEIIKSYSDERIKLIRNKENLGIVSNLNKGIILAKGKYIARMDADDISLNTRLEEQYQFMESYENIAVCGTWVKFIGVEKKWLEDNILKNPSNPEEIRCCFLFNCVLKHPSVMIREKVLYQEGYQYNEKVNRAEDYDMWVRISKKYALSNVEKVLLKYREHENNISRVHKKENVKQANEIRKKLLLELGVKYKKKEFELHYELSKIHRREFPYQLLSTYSDWLQKIYNSNKGSRIYDDKSLLTVLSQKWSEISTCIPTPEWIRLKVE